MSPIGAVLGSLGYLQKNEFQTGSETSYSVHRVNFEVCAELDVIRGDNETS